MTLRVDLGFVDEGGDRRRQLSDEDQHQKHRELQTHIHPRIHTQTHTHSLANSVPQTKHEHKFDMAVDRGSFLVTPETAVV